MLDREQNRDAHLHLLGDLTLVSPAMNPALSNRPWPEKRELLREHSQANWNEEAIRARRETLIDDLVRFWPGPEGSFSEPRPLWKGPRAQRPSTAFLPSGRFRRCVDA
jgi:hypothetical protein